MPVLVEALPQLARGTLKLQPQDETNRRIVPQRSPEDGLIEWNKDATSIDRFIRAQTRPYSGAFSTLDGKPLHIWQAQVDTVVNEESEAGCVRRKQEGVYTVTCGAAAITLIEITYDQRTYTRADLVELFGEAGQRLGEP